MRLRFPLFDGMRSAGHSSEATLFLTVDSAILYWWAMSFTSAHVRAAIRSRSLLGGVGPLGGE